MAAQDNSLFKFLMQGDSSVGKTSLMLCFAEHTFTDSQLCIVGLNCKLKSFDIDSKLIKVQIMDRGAQPLRKTPTAYYRRIHGIFVLYDVTDRETFNDVPRLLDLIKSHADVVILLLGNKSDLATQRAVSFEEGKALADEFRVSFMEISARTCANVAAAFIAMAVQVKARVDYSVVRP
jgi:Ras-related protein Rab-1A